MRRRVGRMTLHDLDQVGMMMMMEMVEEIRSKSCRDNHETKKSCPGSTAIVEASGLSIYPQQ